MTTKWTTVEGMKLRELAAEGFNSEKIAQKMGKTRGQVMGYIARNKIELAGRRGTGPMKDVRGGPKKPIPASAKKPERGNNHFNVRRAVELSKAPVTQPQWPKPENEHSVPFLEAKEDHCRMPLWGTKPKTGMICGRPRMKNGKVYVSHYCAGCHALTLPD